MIGIESLFDCSLSHPHSRMPTERGESRNINTQSIDCAVKSLIPNATVVHVVLIKCSFESKVSFGRHCKDVNFDAVNDFRLIFDQLCFIGRSRCGTAVTSCGKGFNFS